MKSNLTCHVPVLCMLNDTSARPLNRLTGIWSLQHPAFILTVASFLVVLAGALNATFIYDDPYLVIHYAQLQKAHSLAESLRILFFSEDLSGAEYRLYGLSKILHFFLWHVGGVHAWVYGTFIAGSQLASGFGIYWTLKRLLIDPLQAFLVASVWVLSPFAVTACFHHYSYLLLPYQVMVGCAVLLIQVQEEGAVTWRCRVGLALGGFALVSTGESHLPAALLVFLLLAIYSPSRRSKDSRALDVLIPLAVMFTVVVFHRAIFSILTARFHVNHERFFFNIPNYAVFHQRTLDLFHSVPLGIGDQLGPIFALAGKWTIVTGAAVLAGVLLLNKSSWMQRRKQEMSSAKGFGLVTSLALLFVASWTMVFLVDLITGEVSPIMPRRYGYAPNTFMAMMVVAFLAAPGLRRIFGALPALLGSGSVIWVWLSLQCVCLPMVRLQDAKVWAAVSGAMHQHQNASVLFVNNWDDFQQPEFNFSIGTPGPRGREFPQVFESSLSYFWWESEYAVAVLGARFAAYRYDPVDAKSVRLSGNGLMGYEGYPPVTVPRDSVVVLEDPALRSSVFPKLRNRPIVISNFSDFEQSIAAHGGASMGARPATAPPLKLPESEVHINIAQGVPHAPQSLPDKRFQDPFQAVGFIANYGVEDTSGSPGSFTYRVDFADQRPKDIWLDFVKVAAVNIDVQYDQQWFNVAKNLDPVAQTLEISPGTAQTVRIRLAPVKGTTTVPLLSDLRVSRY